MYAWTTRLDISLALENGARIKKEMHRMTNVYTFTVEMLPTNKQKVAIERQMLVASTIQNLMKKNLYDKYTQYNRRKDVRHMLAVLRKTKKLSDKSAINRRVQINKDLQFLRKQYGLTEYAAHKHIAILRDSIKQNLHSHILQKIASRAWQSIEKLLYQPENKVRYLGKQEYSSLEGKTNRTGYRIKEEVLYTPFGRVRLAWKRDIYTNDVLKRLNEGHDHIQFTRVLRKEIRGKVRFYCQIIIKGNPPVKKRQDGSIRHPIGHSKMGIDVGVTSVAVSSPSILRYYSLNPTINGRSLITKEKAKGKIFEKQKREIARVEREKRREVHQRLINELMTKADVFYIEEMNFQCIKKRKRKGEISFGKTIEYHAPALFVELLEKKLNHSGGTFYQVNTARFCASQWDHTNEEKKKVSLSERTKILSDGTTVLRDAYSAFLLEHADNTLCQPAADLCKLHFDRFVRLQALEIKRLQEMDRYIQASGVKNTNKKAGKW